MGRDKLMEAIERLLNQANDEILSLTYEYLIHAVK